MSKMKKRRACLAISLALMLLCCIVTSHGIFNNKGMQDLNFVELAHRGFVVPAQDMPSHGDSEDVDNVVSTLMGMYESVKELAGMPFVDSTRIGVTGHSLGGISCNMSVNLDNMAETPLVAAVLLNSADATYSSEEGFFIHPWSHFCKRSTTATIEFFDQALGAPNPIPSGNQIWQVKAVFNLLGLAGFRIRVLAVRAFKLKQLGVTFAPYAFLFLVYYIADSVALNCFNYNDVGLSKTGRIIYREAKNPYLPGMICGVLVAIISCTNTLTMAG